MAWSRFRGFHVVVYRHAIPCPLDCSHEGGWRVPSNLVFDYADVALVVVEQFEDVVEIAPNAVNAIGKVRFRWRTTARLKRSGPPSTFLADPGPNQHARVLGETVFCGRTPRKQNPPLTRGFPVAVMLL